MVFAREINDNLTSLVKKIDAATGTKSLNSFVVFLSDEEGMEDKIKSFAETNKIKKMVLALDNVAGPKEYKVAKDAAVTVVLYNKRKVESNFAFKKGEMDAAAVDKVVKDLSKITP